MIREMRVTDAPAIQLINKASLGYEFPVDGTKKQLQTILTLPTNQIFVYENEANLVVGYIHLADYENTYHKSLKNIVTLAVRPDYQKQGIAKRLLERGQQWAKEHGSAGIRLVTGFERKQARRFYENNGFKKRKDQTNYIKWWEEDEYDHLYQ